MQSKRTSWEYSCFPWSMDFTSNLTFHGLSSASIFQISSTRNVSRVSTETLDIVSLWFKWEMMCSSSISKASILNLDSSDSTLSSAYMTFSQQSSRSRSWVDRARSSLTPFQLRSKKKVLRKRSLTNYSFSIRKAFWTNLRAKIRWSWWSMPFRTSWSLK